MKKALIGALAMGIFCCAPIHVQASELEELGEYGRPYLYETTDTAEQIAEEIKLGEMELIAQLVQAEAGNQSFEGKCLVVDVVLNRIADPRFPNTAEEVIFQKYKGHYQFSVIKNGAWEKAAWNMTDEDYKAVVQEVTNRTNSDVLYFCSTNYIPKTKPLFKCGAHYFSM